MNIHNPYDQPVRQKIMPVPHMMIRLIRANNTFFVANRGGFKTTMGISFYLVDCVAEMPQSTGIICGPSYEHLGDNTLNPLFNALNEDGFEPGVHYVIGTAPPSNWEKPFITVPAKKYDHLISFWNGANIFLISLAKKGSANGISAQWGIFDEVKLMDERELTDVVFPVFRGSEQSVITEEGHPNQGKQLQELPLFMSKFFSTDKLIDPAKLQWILDKRKLNDERKLDLVLHLQLALNDLKDEYNQAGINKRQKLQTTINAVEVRLSKLRATTTFYVESDHTHTQQILGTRWFADKTKNMKPYEVKVAIKNEDPDRPEDGFYPDMDLSRHVHNLDCYNPNRPFIIAADYQHSVSPIPVTQIDKLPGEKMPSLNFVDEVYTLSPEGLADAVMQFKQRYAAHTNKKVYYIYDQTAKGRRVDGEKYFEIVANTLKNKIHGRWKVIHVYTGAAPTHYDKYNNMKSWLKEEDPKAMRIRFHSKCDRTIKSMTSAPAKVTNGKTEKDKKYENTINYPGLDQSTTTHFSDTVDMICHAVLKLHRISYINTFGGSLGLR